jgi:hypothetical protein
MGQVRRSKLATEQARWARNPTAVTYITPDQRKWRDPLTVATNAAMLVGDQSKTGFYLYQCVQPGNSSRPHYHERPLYHGTQRHGGSARATSTT